MTVVGFIRIKCNDLMENSQKLGELISSGRFHEAIGVLTESIAQSPDEDNLYFQRGKLKWRIGDRTGAANDYSMAIELNPHSPAAFALEQARDVADFFNPDLYNP